ncbi:hypothetical protein Q7C36_008779 [Tachysurus vachellii]|uniref:Uncharacterized protein n=1 Tax=Tachysurus vachellii TaxID=175792 RepID=A0AA88NA04_TACVA|nr:hypothetical protein Q7C36_008779 [Tachysurus vachellii]
MNRLSILYLTNVSKSCGEFFHLLNRIYPCRGNKVETRHQVFTEPEHILVLCLVVTSKKISLSEKQTTLLLMASQSTFKFS